MCLIDTVPVTFMLTFLKSILNSYRSQFDNLLSANPTKWSNTLKQFADESKLPTNCLGVFDHFMGLVIKGLISTANQWLVSV